MHVVGLFLLEYSLKNVYFYLLKFFLSLTLLMMDVVAINELGNKWELMDWRFVVGGVKVVVGRQKGSK